jgi:putative ABC transport system ATP-binding protein
MMTAPILETHAVTKIYGEGAGRVVALDSVSLSLQRGQMLLIMGPSGSGKTTLLSVMGCILRPTSGRVVVDGQDVSELGEDALPDIRRRYFGFVFQSFNLFGTLTALENVEVVLRMKGTPKHALASQSLALLERVGLGPRAHAYPRDLSGGEKQRTALARAMASEPPIVLADEPTANLDSRTGHEVLALLRALADETGKAVAIVSHDPKAVDLAHQVLELEDGRLKPS